VKEIPSPRRESNSRTPIIQPALRFTPTSNEKVLENVSMPKHDFI